MPSPTSPTPGGPGWKSSEFAGTVAALVANVTMVFVLCGTLSPAAGADLSERLTQAVMAVGVAATNVAAVWRYVASREQLKRDGNLFQGGVSVVPDKDADPAG